jgi:glyoxylase-like metal-dependent hydrolase (beta-lactamase superfamily II)
MSAELLVLPIGPLRTNVALIGDTDRREAIVIDPAIPSLADLVARLAEREWRLVLALVTHGHWDHTGELAALAEHVQQHEGRALPIAVHERDRHRLEDPRPLAAPFPIPAVIPTRDLREGDHIHAGEINLAVLHTPGHTEGSISLHDAAAGVLYSGDTLFRGAWGRTDLPGGDAVAMLASLQRLAGLDPATRVIPGHGRETTIAAEHAWISSAGRIGHLGRLHE